MNENPDNLCDDPDWRAKREAVLAVPLQVAGVRVSVGHVRFGSRSC